MAINTPLRVVIGLGAIGGTLGTGYFINQQLSTENIRKKLIANGYEILEKTSEEWTEILKHYKKRISDNKKDLQFDDFDGTQPTQNAEDVLKTKCEKILDTTKINENDYKKAIRWCTKPKKISEILKEQKYISLNTDSGVGKDEDVDAWDKKMEEHEKHPNSEEKISDLNLDSSKGVKKEKAERDKLRNKCKEFENKKHYEEDFETTLTKSKLWCANK